MTRQNLPDRISSWKDFSDFSSRLGEPARDFQRRESLQPRGCSQTGAPLSISSLLLPFSGTTTLSRGWPRSTEAPIAIARHTAAFPNSEVLRRFTLTLDYRHRRLLLSPNGALRDPFEVEMLGAGFKAADLKFDRILVRYVLPNSPASEAGLQEGDEIVAVDGRSAAPLTVGGLRALFTEPDKRHTLRTRRGGREGEVAIVTRRLV